MRLVLAVIDSAAMFASVGLVRAELEQLAAGFKASELDRDGSVRMLSELGRIRRLNDALIARCAARVAATEGAGRSGDRDATATCARLTGGSRGEARALIETGSKAESSAGLDAASRAGDLTPRQVRLIADTTKVVPDAEPELVAAAGRGQSALEDACRRARARVETDAERTRRQRAARFLWMSTDADGMTRGGFALTPEIGGQVRAIVDDYVRRAFRRKRGDEAEPHERHAADALGEAFLGADAVRAALDLKGKARNELDRDGESNEGHGDDHDDRNEDHGEGARRDAVVGGPVAPTATVHVIVDHAALVRGEVLDGEQCEIPGVGPVNLAWVRSLLGTAFVTAVIKHGRDIKTIAHFGRHINAHLRTALIVGGRECVVEGCGAYGYLEIDHRDDHAARGPTSLANLDYICPLDHRRKTAGWTLGPANPATHKRKLHPPGTQTAAA